MTGADRPTPEETRAKFGYGPDQGTPTITPRTDRDDDSAPDGDTAPDDDAADDSGDTATRDG